MSGKKSIIDLLPAVGTDNDRSDFPFRFNRHSPGDYLNSDQQQGDAKDQTEEDLCQKIEKAEKPKLVPPAGIPPPTAEELIKLKNSQPTSVVDFCSPVEYQFMPIDIPDSDLTDSVYWSISADIPANPLRAQDCWLHLAGVAVTDATIITSSEVERGIWVCHPADTTRTSSIKFGKSSGAHQNCATMPRLEGMHAPGNQCAHVLPRAGFPLPYPSDVFRFNRVTAYYPPDPCIRPNEGDLTCPRQCPPQQVNHPCMPPAGTDSRMLSDVFRFHKVYQSTGYNPCKQADPPSCACRLGPLPCPCTNTPRYPPSKPSKHFDFRYPAGVTGCNAATHRRGHVPQECTVIYPGPDEIIYTDKPEPSDCTICPPTGCSCEQCARIHGIQEHTLRVQNRMANNRVPPGFNTPPSGPNNHIVSNVSKSVNTSMYNNTSKASAFSGQGDYRSPCFPDPCAITGNIHYNSQGYSTDRSCTQVPVQRADKVPDFASPCPYCPHPYNPSCHVCRPVYNRKYLMDCPEQDGPPADTYTFL